MPRAVGLRWFTVVACSMAFAIPSSRAQTVDLGFNPGANQPGSAQGPRDDAEP